MASSRNSLSTEAFSDIVRSHLDRLVPYGAKVAVGFSGGLDSRLLLHYAVAHAASGACELMAVHVHHGLNPAADEWAKFAESVCSSYGVSLEVVQVRVPDGTGEGVEGAARRLRYNVFEQLSCDHILLAHHADDQAETLLLNLLRGCGVKGAAGMQAESGAANRYLRPFLGFRRAALDAHAQALGLLWVDDSSNTDVRFTRNFMRHQVLPALETRFPAAIDCLARAAGHFAEAQEMLDEMAIHDLAGHPPQFPLTIAVLLGLSERRALNVMRYLLGIAGLQAPSKVQMQEGLRQFQEAAPDKHPHLCLPGYRLYRRKGEIHIEVHSS